MRWCNFWLSERRSSPLIQYNTYPQPQNSIRNLSKSSKSKLAIKNWVLRSKGSGPSYKTAFWKFIQMRRRGAVFGEWEFDVQHLWPLVRALGTLVHTSRLKIDFHRHLWIKSSDTVVPGRSRWTHRDYCVHLSISELSHSDTSIKTLQLSESTGRRRNSVITKSMRREKPTMAQRQMATQYHDADGCMIIQQW